MVSLRALWNKIKKEKKRFFRCSRAVHHVPYDHNSYSQNFDDGYSTDPDNVSRSFSARFAVPSKIFDKSEVVSDDKRNIVGSWVLLDPKFHFPHRVELDIVVICDHALDLYMKLK